jgi:hypothetical protein
MNDVELRDQGLLEQAIQHVSDEPLLVMPLTGEVLDLRKPSNVARGLEQVRETKRQLDELRLLFEALLRIEAARLGSKTLHVGDGLTATVTGGEKTEWDIPVLNNELRAAGLPQERLEELITITVDYKVDARVAKQLAGANPEYAAIIARAKRTGPAAWRVYVKREGEP